MRTVGLITEYNPFHNGHLHHLKESKRVTESSVSVAVMSGHFLQRGEPALVDKWVRAEMALAAGVDLVVELPLPWAASSAPDFARGAVAALIALGVDSLCFGSESGEIIALQRCAEFLIDHDDLVTEKTAELLRQGVNYPQARAQLAMELLPADLDPAILNAPNNILGIEYLKALCLLDGTLDVATIRRIGAGFHDLGPAANGIASATGIRNLLMQGKRVDELLPVAAGVLLHPYVTTGETLSTENYFRLLAAQIFRNGDRLIDCWLVDNGIENRLQHAAAEAATLEELLAGIKTRQFTRTRIQRILVSLLLEMERGVVSQLLAAGPFYLHLLAVNRKGEQFLASRRKQRTLPLVQNFSRVIATLKRYYGTGSDHYQLAMQQLDLELRATKMYTLLLHNYPSGSRNRDFYMNLKRRS